MATNCELCETAIVSLLKQKGQVGGRQIPTGAAPEAKSGGYPWERVRDPWETVRASGSDDFHHIFALPLGGQQCGIGPAKQLFRAIPGFEQRTPRAQGDFRPSQGTPEPVLDPSPDTFGHLADDGFVRAGHHHADLPPAIPRGPRTDPDILV